VFNHTVCLILYQMCLESPLARVTGIHSRQRSKWRPLPLDTVEMEKQASRKLRINAKETMRIAEKLYTQGFISYPRTETNMFPESFDLPAIVRDQTPHPNWGGFASQLLARGVTPRQGNKTDNAHPPIHPTKYTNSLQGNEQRIYEYVVRHFLACCSQNAEGHETSVEIEVAGEGFSAQGLAITARNYLDVFPYDKWSDKTMPVYQENSTFQPSSIEMVEGETSPPSLLQEADLIALMEKHGVGTDATHAEHIETIKNRNYVGVQSDGHFVPGELGMGLVEGYDAMGYELAKPRLRAELENDLKLICDGVKRKDDVLTLTVNKYKDVFHKASQEAHRLDESLSKYFGPPQQVTQQGMNARFSRHIIFHAKAKTLLLAILVQNCRFAQVLHNCHFAQLSFLTLLLWLIMN
jgi:DNA topoisomerase-3